MATLLGKHINLRALEPTDLEFLFACENNESFWEISSTQTPFSKYILQKYIENSHQDIYEAKQYRFVICDTENIAVGMIDLFDFNPQHKRVGLGILLTSENQHKGYGSEALEMIIDYAFTHLHVHQIFANITSDNFNSISLFEKFNFIKTGEKKDWIFSNNNFKNELLYQLIRNTNEH
ncbi:MAG: GNAT family N-acetyltransferase [Lutibacter sp.]|uniref:GNAT family N-acetyltransferase n=1 Tax=Lutibacter sp. TaxID=1925666 RepID=UPI00181D0C34|nr:GNAT family N-acetyltransferase [Lutibacter sp.]MBT8316860.1 GNAT family N-acetyltransferase [Lutibacter sp.]NNJ57720.1 GNAT family N-acetyltransferase [Lutibacter sp.]